MAGKRDDRRVEFTKMLLRQSLTQLMHSKPIHKLTVKEICETAELNRGTFYAHFSDQHDLLRHTEDVEMEKVIKSVVRIAKCPAGQREALCVELMFSLRENSSVWGALLSENGNADLSKRMFGKLFAELAEAGICGADDPCAKLMVTHMMVGCIGMVSFWLGGVPSVTPEQAGKLIYRILSEDLLKGIAE